MDDAHPPGPGETPDERSTRGTVLDSILRPDGPMPTAGIGMRALALAMDCILLVAVSILILSKFALPAAHPGALYEFQEWVRLAGESPAGTTPEMSPSLLEALAFAQNFMILLFWTYFAAGEAFFHGSSLGKRACRLRSVSLVTLDHPPVMTGMVRAGVKTMVLFFAFPLLALDLLVLLFNKRRQLGHDLITRTAVIDEKFVKTEKP